VAEEVETSEAATVDGTGLGETASARTPAEKSSRLERYSR
jgi:hypothetical protein